MRLYRLVYLALLLCAALSLAVLAQAQDSYASPADLAAMEHCHLTLESVKRTYQAQADLTAATQGNATLLQKLHDSPESIDTLTRRLQAEPVFVAALTRNGFTPHDYAVTEFTLVQTIFALMAKMEGSDAAVIAKLHVAPGNIALFEQHGDEIKAFQAKNKQP